MGENLVRKLIAGFFFTLSLKRNNFPECFEEIPWLFNLGIQFLEIKYIYIENHLISEQKTIKLLWKLDVEKEGENAEEVID